jgi:hypothetical protein
MAERAGAILVVEVDDAHAEEERLGGLGVEFLADPDEPAAADEVRLEPAAAAGGAYPLVGMLGWAGGAGIDV